MPLEGPIIILRYKAIRKRLQGVIDGVKRVFRIWRWKGIFRREENEGEQVENG
jgi:hypothetical protein